MSTGSGIFLSALFLGCIFLYIKSEDKAKWRKVSLWCSVAVILSFVLFMLNAMYEDHTIDKLSREKVKQTDSFTDIRGIRLGESMSDLKFRHGDLKQSEMTRGYESYVTDLGVTVFAKYNVVEMLTYVCDKDQVKELIRGVQLGGISCGSSEETILSKFGKSDVEIMCFEDDPQTRFYGIKKHNIFYILTKNSVNFLSVNSNRIEQPIGIKSCKS